MASPRTPAERALKLELSRYGTDTFRLLGCGLALLGFAALGLAESAPLLFILALLGSLPFFYFVARRITVGKRSNEARARQRLGLPPTGKDEGGTLF
jgi:hypothetical protein